MKKIFFKMTCFCLIFLIVYINITELLKDKRMYLPYDITKKVRGFYNEKPNSLDVVFIGSSHAYFSLNPALFWNEYGIPSYMFGANEQPLWISYHYIKEVLKYQNPKVIVLDIRYSQNITDFGDPETSEEYHKEGTNRLNLDDLNFSLNKLEAIKASVPKNQLSSYVLELMKYHTKWKNLNSDNFKYLNYKDINPYKGYTVAFHGGLEPNSFTLDKFSITDKMDIPPKTLTYLNKIIELSKNNSFELLLIKTPCIVDENGQKIHNKVSEIAQKNNIDFINYNLILDELNFNFETDGEWGHTNYLGAEKVSKHLGNYLKTKYKLEDKRNNSDYTKWNESSQYYTQEINNYTLSIETDIYKYLDKLDNPNYMIIISARDEFSSLMNDEILKKFSNLGLTTDVKDKYRWSYLSIIDSQNVIYENLSDSLINFNTTLDELNINALSAGMISGNSSSIKINNIEYSKNLRGLNIVVYDKLLDRIVDSVAFDTHGNLNATR